MTPRRVAILGSTGSIGTSALDVIASLPDRLSAVALTTHERVDELISQISAVRPPYAAVTGVQPTAEQRQRIAHFGTELLVGTDALATIAAKGDVDVVLLAVVGAAGVRASLAAVDAGKTLALANKESLVVAGSLLMELARQRGARILPVDSEHSAIFQCLCCGKQEEVARIILTASGGPFRTVPLEQMRQATVADALRHPTWTMGAKVTIDSATMFNKALEIIEAAWLFDIPADRIEVVVHPQSVVHSLVEYVDGSTIAQLSPPDMRTPIQYALTYPDRAASCPAKLDLTRRHDWTFEPPDLERFPSLAMGFEVVRRRGTSGAALNAANEVAVQALRDRRIRLGMIYEAVRRTLDDHPFLAEPDLGQLLETDRWARAYTTDWMDRASDSGHK